MIFKVNMNLHILCDFLLRIVKVWAVDILKWRSCLKIKNLCTHLHMVAYFCAKLILFHSAVFGEMRGQDGDKKKEKF